MLRLFLMVFITTLLGCSKSTVDANPPVNTSPYFPENNANDWATVNPTTLGWNNEALTALLNYVKQTNAQSFMVLVDGKIAVEAYFNNHNANSTWQWNSAGKTLTTATIGIAQAENLLSIQTPVNRYLGNGWTSAPLNKENLITPWHLLTMTSGLNDENNLVTVNNLTYLADAGTRWSYHNVFQRLMDIVERTSQQSFESYFNNRLRDKIGMDGFWNNGLIFRIYHSNTRSMARFGLLALHKGKWKQTQIVPEPFFTESIQSSQNLNPAYGYLWWLNGKTTYRVPGSQLTLPGTLIPAAPADTYAAMGADDQRIYIVPSKKLVIVRMGDAADPNNPSFAVSGFDNTLWTKINAVIP